MDVEERFEQIIAYVSSQLPRPVDQRPAGDGASLRFIGGDPPEVVVLLTDSSVVVSEFAGVWETAFHFVVKPRRVGVVKWRRLPETPLMNALGALLKGARDARLARFQVCSYCGRNTPPEWLHDDHVCEACSELHSGAIH